MALYMNTSGDTVNATMFTEDEALDRGVEYGSWRIAGTGDSHIVAVVSNEAFRMAYKPLGMSVSEKYVTKSGKIVEARQVPPPHHWNVTDPEGNDSMLSDDDFKKSHTTLSEAHDTKYTNASGETFNASQLSDEAADAKGVDHGSWLLISDRKRESILSDDDFKAEYKKVPAKDEKRSSSSKQSTAQTNEEDKSNSTEKSSSFGSRSSAASEKSSSKSDDGEAKTA